MTVQPMRSAALVTSAALRDDDQSVRLLLHNLPPDMLAIVAEASLLAMAELVRQFVPPHAIAAGISEAQQMAQTEATERNHR